MLTVCCGCGACVLLRLTDRPSMEYQSLDEGADGENGVSLPYMRGLLLVSFLMAAGIALGVVGELSQRQGNASSHGFPLTPLTC